MTIEWREISTEEFYATVGQPDVIPEIINQKYPYTSIWKTRQGVVKGKSVGIENGGNHYYIPKNDIAYSTRGGDAR
jgi:hypothetical protein